jgi:uncharacterized short protein YbdD (DUF466 family)
MWRSAMDELARLWRRAVQTARLMVGIPDYDTYVAHRRTHHPQEPVMSYTEFFRERQKARYGGEGGRISRCC